MTATVSGWVWIDGLTAAQKANMRRELTIYPKKTTDIASVATPNPIELFRDRSDGQFGMPRGYWVKNRTGKHDEVLALAPPVRMQPLKSKWTAEGKYVEQRTIVDVFSNHIRNNAYWGGILEAGVGTGKTEVSVQIAYQLGLKTLVLVGKEFLLRQWKSRIEGLLPGVRVGIIQQDICEWENVDFAISIMQSLSRDDGNKYSMEMYNAFSLLITDECHHVPSDSFAPILPRFTAPYRIGLSATLTRKANDEDVFLNHIGAIAYTATSTSMMPKLRVIKTSNVLKPIQRSWDAKTQKYRYVVPIAKLNSAQVISQLADDPVRTNIIIQDVVQAARYGRKVLVVSERLEQLWAIGEGCKKLLPMVTIGNYTGQWFTDVPGKMRTVKQKEQDAACNCQILLATKQICAEGFDVPSLDVIVLATPFGDAEQIIGRVQRWCDPKPGKCEVVCPWRAGRCEGKKDTIVVDIVDINVGKVMGKWYSRRRLYQQMGIKIPE